MPSGLAPAGDGLHLLHAFSSFEVGGQQIRFVTLANALGARYRHTILSMDGDLACLELLDPALDVRTLTLPVAKGRSLSLGNLRRFRRTLGEIRPHRLLTYNWGAVEWALANRWAPVCGTLHHEDGFGPDESPDRQLRRRVLFRRLALTGNATVVVPSRTLERLALEAWGLRRSRVVHVPNGVDTGRFAPDPEPRPAIPPDGVRVGTIGRLQAEKNPARLLRCFRMALARAPDRRAGLVLAGEGPERGRLEGLAAELGIADRVAFAGRIADPERLLRGLDIFALSSDTEQMPMTLIEAMATGLPVAATDVGDVRAVLAEENRPLVVPCRDEERLADALAALIGDAGLRRRLGAANRARACAELDERRMVARYDALFASAGAVAA